jgi:hypothetical protein
MKSSNDTIWNRTSDLKICSAVRPSYAKYFHQHSILDCFLLYECEIWSLRVRVEYKQKIIFSQCKTPILMSIQNNKQYCSLLYFKNLVQTDLKLRSISGYWQTKIFWES